MSRPQQDEREVLLCDHGPIIVPGPVTVEDEDGVKHHSDRPMVALCRCGASACRPWCDGSHKQVRRREAGPTAVPRPREGRPLEDY